MYDLILYDTSNYQDFPIGGQLTSIRNFLKYIANYQSDYAERILLVGVTTLEQELGQFRRIRIDDVEFDFLPVLCRNLDLSHVRKSLRVEYVKALLGMERKIPCKKETLHYLHTPEAYIAVKLMHPRGKTAVFSHGSFFNMVQGFRFYRENKIVHICFEMFLILLLKTADILLVLDEKTAEQYRKYNKNVFLVENSIVLPEAVPDRLKCHDPIRLLYVGRLSRVKGIDRILEAAEQLRGKAQLTIVGDGEEYEALKKMIAEKNLGENVNLAGSCTPDEVAQFYRQSDILVMNSVVEGKPMVILEAMSYGIPVIATPVGGIPEMVMEGENAEFTDGTAANIKKKIRIISGNYLRYAKNSRKSSEKYSYKLVNSILYEKLLEII